MSELQLFGDRTRFAVGFSFSLDPDGAEPTWGRLQLWVASRNLTSGLTRCGTTMAWAECPLLPVLSWFVDSWDFLFHEERLPLPSESPSAAAWRMGSLRRLPAGPGLASLLEARESYWARHGLGCALPGYRLPDLHLRRRGNAIEVSWDDREWRSVPTGIFLLEPDGTALLPVGEVAEVLEQFLDHAIAALETIQGQALAAAELRARFEALAAPDRKIERLVVSAGDLVRAAAERLRKLAGDPQRPVDSVIAAMVGVEEQEDSPRRWSILPTPILLFRSASPTLTPVDVDTLAELCAKELGRSDALLAPLREYAPCQCPPEEATADGYDRALVIRERLGLSPEQPLRNEVDLETKLLPRLGIGVQDVSLVDARVEALSLGGAGYGPTIAVNRNGRFSPTPWGRRMSLAHELCHLLFDGDAEGRTGVVSNPWAPPLEERRANAFAAMLLAPEPAIAAVLARDSSTWTGEDLYSAMNSLGIGATTLLRQLENLDWISRPEREQWQDRLVARR